MTKEAGQFLDLGLILERTNIHAGMTVADLGCGSHGYFVFPMAKIVGKQGMVYAVDLMKTALENIERMAKGEKMSNIKTIWTNLETFNASGIESGSLDKALLVNSLHQSENRVTIVREAVRMLKKAGQLVIVEWGKAAVPFGPSVEKRLDIENLKANAAKIGLKLDDQFLAGDYHFGLVFSKV